MNLVNEQLVYADLAREDDVGLILRGHLHIEHQLMEVARAALPYGDRCDWENFTYRAKVELAYACGLPKDVRDVLFRIGRMRNKFAHQLNAEITKKSAIDLYNSLSEKHRVVLKESYKVMTKESSFSLREIEPHDLVTLVFLSMHSAIKAAAIALQAMYSNSSIRQ